MYEGRVYFEKTCNYAFNSCCNASTANADQYVNGYYNHNGNYVQGYHRSDRDGNPDNNYSHYGNVNPYTGKRGTVR